MTTIQDYNHPSITVVRHINFRVMDGNRVVDLEEFRSVLNNTTILKTNECLSNHGFKGSVTNIDGKLYYMTN